MHEIRRTKTGGRHAALRRRRARCTRTATRRRVQIGLFLGLCLWAPSPIPAQDQPTGDRDRTGGFAGRVDVGYVLVPVSVRSRNGFVTDLGADDFELTVDGEPVAFDGFDLGADLPLALAFLQDLSGSMGVGRKLDLSRRAVRCFLRGARASDRFALATFADRGLTVEVPFTSDREAFRDALGGWKPYGKTALYDAVSRLPQIRVAESGFRVVGILVTDGAENASGIDPGEAQRIVREADLPVYVLSLSSAPALPDSGGQRRQGDDALLLRRLAGASGGRYLEIRGEIEADTACRSIEQELRSRYILGFVTAPAGESRYREIRVRVKRKRLEIAHRRGYTGRIPR